MAPFGIVYIGALLMFGVYWLLYNTFTAHAGLLILNVKNK